MSSTSSRRKTKRKLGARDAGIFDDVIRYGLVTNQYIHTRYAPDLTPNAIVKITRRLTSQGWLTSHPLFDGRRYYVAGDKLIAFKALARSRMLEFGPQALARRIPALNYAATHQEKMLATEHDLVCRFPWLPTKYRKSFYFINRDDSQSGSCINLFRVDLSGNAKHVARRCEQDVSRRMQVASFARKVRNGEVLFVVATCSEATNYRIKLALSKRNWPRALRFQVVVDAALIHFIGERNVNP